MSGLRRFGGSRARWSAWCWSSAWARLWRSTAALSARSWQGYGIVPRSLAITVSRLATGHAARFIQLYLDVLGARRLLGVPAGELANRLVALEDVVGEFAGELWERLADAPCAQERHATAQRLLAGRLSGDHAPAWEVSYALERLRSTRGAARVETLAAEVGWSRRHLAARFREAVGLPPKAVGRLLRVEHAAQRVRAGDDLADVAYRAGYADQAHFTREFRALVGCTPSQFPFVQDNLIAA